MGSNNYNNYKLPLIEVVSTDIKGITLKVEVDGELRYPSSEQKEGYTIIQMMYDVMDRQLGYFPLNVIGYCVDNSGDRGLITFRCTESVPIDKKQLQGGIKKVKYVV